METEGRDFLARRGALSVRLHRWTSIAGLFLCASWAAGLAEQTAVSPSIRYLAATAAAALLVDLLVALRRPVSKGLSVRADRLATSLELCAFSSCAFGVGARALPWLLLPLAPIVHRAVWATLIPRVDGASRQRSARDPSNVTPPDERIVTDTTATLSR